MYIYQFCTSLCYSYQMREEITIELQGDEKNNGVHYALMVKCYITLLKTNYMYKNSACTGILKQKSKNVLSLSVP